MFIQDEDGQHLADTPELLGCHSQGFTFEEALGNVSETIAMCVREQFEDGKTVEPGFPEVIGLTTLEVIV